MANDGQVLRYHSLADQQDREEVCVGYPGLLRKYLGLNDIHNFAVGGQKTAQQTEIILKKDFRDVDLVIIAVGVNDFSGGTPIGRIPDSLETEHNETFIGSYCTALDHIFTSNPQIHVILMTPLHRYTLHRTGNVPKNTIDSRINGQTLDDFAQAIMGLGRFYACPVVDLYAESGLNRFNWKRYTLEGVHPNNDGYERICWPLISKVRAMMLR